MKLPFAGFGYDHSVKLSSIFEFQNSGFINSYSDVSIVIDGKRIAVEIPQLNAAQEALENYIVQPTITSEVPFETALVESGSYQMGCSGNPCERDSQPAHMVTLTYSIEVMTTEVTQDFYTYITGSNPSQFSDCGGDCPVESVNWFDAVSFAGEMGFKIPRLEEKMISKVSNVDGILFEQDSSNRRITKDRLHPWKIQVSNITSVHRGSARSLTHLGRKQPSLQQGAT